MQVQSKQTLLFSVEGKEFILRPSAHPLFAPDFIRDTQLFKLAINDGTVSEFVPAPGPALEPAPDDKKKK